MPAKDQGVFSERYQIIPRVLIFATRDDLVLLLKGSPDKRLWANLYNGVGGHIEQGEDVLSAAQREFWEETGLDLSDAWLCAAVMIDTGEHTGIGMYIFRGKTSDGDPSPSDEGSLEWISQNDLNNIEMVEDLPIILPKILKLSEGDRPIFAHYSYNSDDELEIKFNEIG